MTDKTQTPPVLWPLWIFEAAEPERKRLAELFKDFIPPRKDGQ